MKTSPLRAIRPPVGAPVSGLSLGLMIACLVLVCSGCGDGEPEPTDPEGEPVVETAAEFTDDQSDEMPDPESDLGVDQGLAEPEQLLVEIEDGRISVDLDSVEPQRLVDAIKQLGGIDIYFIGQPEGLEFTVQFDDLPIEDGIRRILDGANTAFVYEGGEGGDGGNGSGEDRNIRRVFAVYSAIVPPVPVMEGLDILPDVPDPVSYEIPKELEQALADLREDLASGELGRRIQELSTATALEGTADPEELRERIQEILERDLPGELGDATEEPE